ncbi:MAG: HEAT repeat domain-containing protein [bacterium]
MARQPARRRSNRALALVGAALALTLVLSEAIGGRYTDPRDEVLGKLSGDAQILINLDASDLPSTTDMIRLGRQATPAIINGLVNSMNAEVRAACAAVLTGTRDPRAVTALLDALEDPRYDVRSLAIKALGQLESRDATMRLLALLDKPGTSEGIKEEALTALGRLGDPRAVPRLIVYFERTWHHAAGAALWDLRRHLSKDQVARLAVAPLAAGSTAEPPPYDVLAEAIELAARLQIRAARPHLERLYPSQEGLQNKIIHALGRLGDERAVPFLKKLLDPASPARVLNNVAFALDRLGQDVTPFLQEALGDRRAYIRFNAAFVAGDLKKKALVPALSRALTDANDYVRSNAAVALGTIADPSARPALEAASREKNPVVRGDALIALAAIDYDATRARLLAEGITSDHAGTRAKAVEFLVARKDATVIDPVLAVLNPDNYQERALGLQLLGSFDALQSPAATAFLLRTAAAGQHEAYVLLGRFADPQTGFILRQWLSQPAGEQDQLLRIAGRLKDAASKPLIEPWLDEKRSLSGRLHAAFALAAISGEASAGEILAEAIERAPLELKQISARLLTELDVEKVAGLAARLRALLAHEDVYVRLYAARALLARGEQAAFDALKAELDKRIPFIRDEALDILESSPPTHRDRAIQAWLPRADAHLKAELERILTPK